MVFMACVILANGNGPNGVCERDDGAVILGGNGMGSFLGATTLGDLKSVGATSWPAKNGSCTGLVAEDDEGEGDEEVEDEDDDTDGAAATAPVSAPPG